MIWAECNYRDSISSLQHYKTQCLWNNLIRIDRKPVYLREWLANGISGVESFTKDATLFLSYEEFENKHSFKACPLAFSGITATLKKLRKRFKDNIDSPEKEEFKRFIETFLETKKPSNLKYRTLVAIKSEKPRNSQAKWHEDCALEKGEINRKKVFQLTRKCTKGSTLISFQFKFLHRRLPTNSFLYKLQLNIMIAAPFAEKKQNFSPCFLEL